MIARVGDRAALALFVSNLAEQAQSGKVQDAEAAAACRMLDQAGYGHLKVVRHPPAAEPARLPASGHRHDTMAKGLRRCSWRSCSAPRRNAASSTPSTRSSPITGPASCSGCTRCGR